MRGKIKIISIIILVIIIIFAGYYYIIVNASHFGFPNAYDAGSAVNSSLNQTSIIPSGPGLNFIKSEHTEYFNKSSGNLVLNITEFQDNSSRIALDTYIYLIHFYNITDNYKIIKSNITLHGFKYTEFFSIGDIISIGERGDMQFIINLYLTNNTYYLKPGIYTPEIGNISNLTINSMTKSTF